MPNDLSDLLLWRRRRGAPSWLLRDPDTGGLPALDIDYAGNRAFKGSVVDLAGLHTVSRASGGYAENLDGSLTWFGNNVMRRTDRGVLVESARTNLLLRSQEFENAAWSKNNATITANAAMAPDGTVTADLITGSTGSGGYAQQQITQTSGVTDVASLFVKAGSVSWARLSIFSNSAHAETWFNLSGAGSVGTNAAGNTATIAGLANGWYRISIRRTTGGANPFWSFFPCASDGVTCAVGNSAYIWGAQLEAAASASSYIPTGASTATRAFDNVYLADISGLPIAAGTIVGRSFVFSLTAINQVVCAYNNAGTYAVGGGLLFRRTAGTRSLGGYATAAEAGIAANPAHDKWAGSWSIAGTTQRAVTSSNQYANSASLDFTGVDANRLQIGCLNSSGSTALNGYIERLVMFDGLRSQAQMYALLGALP